jgi:hypothetical protein
MADKRLTQSPRALRSSTNDPEKWSKGDVSTSDDPSRYGVGHGQPDPERHRETYQPKYEPKP